MNIKTRPMNLYTKRVFKGAVHRKWCPFSGEVKNIDDEAHTLTARASTMSIDRDGEIVLPSAFMVEDYLKNPMFLWNHRWYGDPSDAIGCVKAVRPTDLALIAKFAYDAAIDPFAKLIWDKVTITKSIRGFSVGFRMVEWVTARDSEDKINALPAEAAGALRRGDVWLVHTKVELIEISQVLIPCNVDSLTDFENVDELMALSFSAPSDAENERTDEMDLTKLSAELDGVKESLKSMSANQETLASALKSVAEAQQATVTALNDFKQTKAAEPPAAAPASKEKLASEVGSLDDLPPAVRKMIVEQVTDQVMEAITQ